MSQTLRLTEADLLALYGRGIRVREPMPGVDIDKVHAKTDVQKAAEKAKRERWEVEFIAQLTLSGWPAPQRNYRPFDDRKLEVDLCWPGVKLAVEVQGGIWQTRKVKRKKDGKEMILPGAHALPSNIERDIEKHNALVMAGWTLLLVTPKTIKSGEALKMVETWMHKGVA